MPEPKTAVLYKVQRRNGSYFAIHEPSSGRLWTERSEQAARAQAQELGFALASAAKSIRHDELMRLLGRDAAPAAAPASRPSIPQPPEDRGADPQARPIRSSAPFVRDQGSEVLISRSENTVASAFASGDPVADPKAAGGADDARRDDVVESRAKPPKGILRNPFADTPKRRGRR